MAKHAFITKLLILLALLAVTVPYTISSTACYRDSPLQKPIEGVSYDSCRKDIIAMRSKLKQVYLNKQITEDSLARTYTALLLDKIIPYWYGTTWDFNGYTAKPGEGTVACGYFVSTTLQHSGMNLNRYKMAQKSSMDGALMLETRDSLDIIHATRDEFVAKFKSKAKDGLYMVGLSFHVGYLYKSGPAIKFIHSSYLSPNCVVMEDAATSEALGQSKVFVVADITYNNKLLRKWLNNEVIPHR